MASQKLQFLSKIDPSKAVEVVAKRAAAARRRLRPRRPAAAGRRGAEAQAPKIFAGARRSGSRRTRASRSEVGATRAVQRQGPDGVWAVDLDGAAAQRARAKADATHHARRRGPRRARRAARRRAEPLPARQAAGRRRRRRRAPPRLPQGPRLNADQTKEQSHGTQSQCHRRRDGQVRQAGRERGVQRDGGEGRRRPRSPTRRSTFNDVEQAYAGYVYGDSTCGQRAVYELGLTGIPVFNVNNNCSTGSHRAHARRAGGRGRPRRVRARRRLREDGEGRARREVRPTARTRSTSTSNVMNEVQGFNQAPPAAQMFGGAGREYRWKYGTKRETFAKISREGAQARGEEPVRAVQGGALGRGDPRLARGVRSAHALPVLPADVRRGRGDPVLRRVREEARHHEARSTSRPRR